MYFTLDTISGTNKYVLDELNEKFPNLRIVQKTELQIEFSSAYEINAYSALRAPLRIRDESGAVRRLDRPKWRKRYVPAGINPSLAYIMGRIAEIGAQDTVWDPFCGAGVLPITALAEFGARFAICSDISGKAVDKAQANFHAAKISNNRYMLFRSGIGRVRLNVNSIDKILTNLPFGIRVGDHDKNIRTYTKLFDKARKVLGPDGVVVALTQEKRLLREVTKTHGFQVVKTVQVEQGGLRPAIFVCKRK